MPPNDDSLLEPHDWNHFRQEAHRALDLALDFARERPGEPVWQEIPDHIKTLDDPLPEQGQPLSEVVSQVSDTIFPHTLGNTHPRFWGWVNGSGTPSGIVAQLLTGAINANMGGRDHAPIYIERQVVQWMRTLFSYPESASGLVCTGTSNATLLGLAVARQRALGGDVRQQGNAGEDLVAYCSVQAHISVSKAVELLGLGTEAVRLVPVGEDWAMDCAALDGMITADLAAGRRPFAVVSSVGSVNTGAIDDLQAVVQICARNSLWHHVDGAFGALVALSPALRPRIAGIEQADSIAFDFHKWMHVTYSAACLLVRDGSLHRETFETFHPYLRGENRGAAGGAPWPTDFGIDLSRGFSALGVWMLLKEMGTERLGAAIEKNCQQAAWLAEQVESAPQLELLAPVALNIVCFRYVPAGLSAEELNRLNRHIVVELQCRGIAVPSFTELGGKTAIRVCLTNHRTRTADLEVLLEAAQEIGVELIEEGDGEEGFALVGAHSVGD